MFLLWFSLSIIIIITGAIIALLIIPFPLDMRAKFTSWISKTIYPFYFLILIFFAFFLNEFFEQRKLYQKHVEYIKTSLNRSPTTPFDVEYFKHQRNMYIILLMIALTAISLIFSRVLARLIGENSDLNDQLELRRQAQRNAHED